ncbi:hypothetical protein Goshw_009048 [Gossypium schwendimanii]|uniref:Uncharacterized protein n=1 Tax=Gossypium schwendimanii TaxID=34291 RepID=A0A7J9NBL0_GOSSC|nr:hypothetical protein [Gossypium schwendimanii]
MTTPEYSGWWSKKVNDNIPGPREDGVRSIEEHLQVVPSELEIIKQDFEKRSSELVKRIEQLEEEKMHLGLDVDIYKLETEKLKKGKNKAEEDLDGLKTDYKKLRLSIRTVGLGKTSKHRNSTIELRASLNEIEELKGMIGELEDPLHNSELRVELLERSNELLAGWNDKGKSPIDDAGDDHDDPAYPPGFTLTNIQAQPEVYPQRVPVTIRPQYQLVPRYQCIFKRAQVLISGITPPILWSLISMTWQK